jgi:hypothetical protein
VRASRHRWLRWLALTMMTAVVVSLAVSRTANADPPRYECPMTISDCVVVTGDWLDVPAQGIGDPGREMDQLVCPSGIPVGYTYDGGIDRRTAVYLQVWPNDPFTRNPWNPAAGADRAWFEILNMGGATTVRIRVGCAPAKVATAGPPHAPREQVERTFAERLGPSQTATYTHACARGQRLVSVDPTVAFRTRRRPSRAELTAVAVHDRQQGNAAAVRVVTTRRLTTSARAVLRIYEFCDA